MNKTQFNDNANIISKNLHKYRKMRKLSQEDLVAQMQLLGIDISQPLISKIERNERFVKDFELAAICKILEVSERDMLSAFYEPE